MAERSGMTALINYVERLINDEANAYHSTQEIQDALDQNRREARYMSLVPLQSIAEGGVVSYVTYVPLEPETMRFWEDTALLLDNDYATLTPSSSDWMVGRWTFATEPDQPVKILGYYYDPFGAAYDLLMVRASSLAENINSFSSQEGSVSYVTKRQEVQSMANKMLAQAWSRGLRTSRIMRSDVNKLW